MIRWMAIGILSAYIFIFDVRANEYCDEECYADIYAQEDEEANIRTFDIHPDEVQAREQLIQLFIDGDQLITEGEY